jgi:hypothetical protein
LSSYPVCFSSCRASCLSWRRSGVSTLAKGSSSNITLGLRREGANQRDALLLTAGKRMWVSLGECGKADPVEQLFDDLIALRRGKATQTECHVLRHGQMRKQRMILEH